VRGSCDHTLEPLGYNVITLTKGNGTVTVDVRWTWDGVSVWPECDGPVVQVHYTNTGTETWYAHLPRKTRGVTDVAITPGEDQVVSGNALRQAGLDTLGTILGLTLNQSPTG
jgi:hypothetical protein